jgi:hypothetical protein
VTVTINGILGVTYTGGPINPVPISETPKIGDPNLAFIAKPRPVHRMWSDFKIDGRGLIEMCGAYLNDAQNLVKVAQGVAQEVHGKSALTKPN